MVKGGQTLSATEFAALTGVSRERLRTWERRHGFPEPVRAHGGARRYAVDDVPRVVAVRRAVEGGVPLTAAVQGTDLPTGAPISLDAQASLAERAPVAVVVLTGPEPLEVAWSNAAVRHRPGAPARGDDVLAAAPWFAGTPGHETLRRLFTTDVVAAACEHPDWSNGCEPGAHSLAFRLPQEDGAAPLVALIAIDTARERRTRSQLAAAEADRDELRARVDEDERAAAALAALSDLVRLRGGAGMLADATALLVRRLGLIDCGLAPYMAGSLVLGRSSRSLLGPEMVTVSRHDELGEALREGEATWLRPATVRAFGAPAGVAVLALPMLAAGEALGALLLVHDDVHELSPTRERILRAVSTQLAFALLRERTSGDLAMTGT